MRLRTKSSMARLLLAGLVVVALGTRAADYTRDMVQAVDMSKNSITLAHEKPMSVSDECKVMMNGKTASLSDVKEGDKVRVATSGRGGSRRIVEIWILQSGATSTGNGSSAK